MFSTRANIIREHRQAGKISHELRGKVLYLAKNHWKWAFTDNDYTANSYVVKKKVL